MKIHTKKIIRRNNQEHYSDYKKYRQALQEDFNYECGYCGKIEKVTRREFEIDHFVPKRLDANRVTDYSNLVYSCFNCNRKKGAKFPTENKDVCFKDGIGILDPASEEFDKNIERTEEGDIIGITPLGKYICEKVFKFNERPMRQVWKAMRLVEKKNDLKTKIKNGNLSSDFIKLYIEIDELLDELLDVFFNKGE